MACDEAVALAAVRTVDSGGSFVLHLAGLHHDLQWLIGETARRGHTPPHRRGRWAMDLCRASATQRAARYCTPSHILVVKLSPRELLRGFLLNQVTVRPGHSNMIDLWQLPAPEHDMVIDILRTEDDNAAAVAPTEGDAEGRAVRQRTM